MIEEPFRQLNLSFSTKPLKSFDTDRPRQSIIKLCKDSYLVLSNAFAVQKLVPHQMLRVSMAKASVKPSHVVVKELEVKVAKVQGSCA